MSLKMDRITVVNQIRCLLMTKLHVGCGWRDFGDDWTHIDGGEYPHIQYFSVRLETFPDNHADVIYASHVFEYFDREEGLEVLNEWHRVLKPNGILRLAVPDFSAMTSLYQKGEVKLDQILGPLYGKMKMSSKVIYHKTVYDYESLESILKESNFVNVSRYDWRETEHAHHDDHSQAYIPHMDKENGTLISLNVEAFK